MSRFSVKVDINESLDKFANLFHSHKLARQQHYALVLWKRELGILEIYDDQHGYVRNLCNGVAKSANKSKNRARLYGPRFSDFITSLASSTSGQMFTLIR